MRIWLAILLACSAPPPVAGTRLPPNPTDTQLEAERKRIQAEVRAYVAALEEEGRYDCCVKVPCSHCAMLATGCACGEGLRRGEPVCEECAYLWTKGQGDEPVDPSKVRSFLEAAKNCACAEHKP